MRAQQQGRYIKIKICWDHLAINKIRNPLVKEVIVRCCHNVGVTRLRFEDLFRMEFLNTTAKPKSIAVSGNEPSSANPEAETAVLEIDGPELSTPAPDESRLCQIINNDYNLNLGFFNFKHY